MASRLSLPSWITEEREAASDEGAVTLAMQSMNRHPISTFLRDLAKGLATFDWR